MSLLREYIRVLLIEQNQTLEQVVQQFREELEREWDWEGDRGCFKGMCSTISGELVERLKENGINASRVNGSYVEPSEDYEPDMSMWDQEDIDQYYEDKEYGDIPAVNHWWVEAQGKIIDVTADQFHPGEESDYRIVMVPSGHYNYGDPL
jgi:hypothetical protein